MKVFILEDDMFRLKILAERLYADHDCDVAMSCSEIDKFKGPYDLILLDHDLGGRQMDQHEDCGATFVKLLGDKIKESRATVVFHSYNPTGASNMRAIVGHGLIAPFGGTMFNRAIDEVERLCEDDGA